MNSNGLIIVHTGEGKGKTTAALGLALRAWGDGLRVLILQFIKGSWEYGELKAIEKLKELDGSIEVCQCGLGFTRRDSKNAEEHKRAAADALKKANEAISNGKWDMVILDEINYAVKFELISENDLLDLIEKKPASIHLVLTGRDALPSLIDHADLVTEMKLIKHPFQQGIKAQKGIEF